MIGWMTIFLKFHINRIALIKNLQTFNCSGRKNNHGLIQFSMQTLLLIRKTRRFSMFLCFPMESTIYFQTSLLSTLSSCNCFNAPFANHQHGSQYAFQFIKEKYSHLYVQFSHQTCKHHSKLSYRKDLLPPFFHKGPLGL